MKNKPASLEHKHKYPPLPTLMELGLSATALLEHGPQSSRLKRMGKFRFQLLADWIASTFEPCRVGDIGGGKGLLALLLTQAKFEAVVVDPQHQELPLKYKDIHSSQRVQLSGKEQVKRRSTDFLPAHAEDFDLLVGLHAHGSNINIIEGAALHQKSFVLLPCCIVGEPAVPPPNLSWFTWLANHARLKGFEISYFALNFKGQNIGFYGVGRDGAKLHSKTVA